jgi:hypothetical protein
MLRLKQLFSALGVTLDVRGWRKTGRRDSQRD